MSSQQLKLKSFNLVKLAEKNGLKYYWLKQGEVLKII
jgi:hypothetical protein